MESGWLAQLEKEVQMNSEEREYIAVVINYFWGDGLAASHSVNDEAAEVVYFALKEAQSCSASMDMVPSPATGKPGLKYIAKQLAKIGKDIAVGDTPVYESCRARVASLYKSKVKLALIWI